MDLLTVGDVLVDVAVEGSGHGAEIRIRPGGSAANAAVWAAAAGGRAAVVGRVGDDLPGRLVRAALEGRGVRTLLAVDPARRTGCVATTPAGLAADRGASVALAVADLPDELRAGAVLVSGYALFQPGAEEAARAALARAEAEWVAVDAGERVRVDLRAAADANAVFANEAAAAALTGRPAEQAAAELGRAFRLACVTRGAAGAVASLDGELASATAPEVAVTDPTGAGDAFAARLLLGLVRGERLADAVAAGCRLGAAAAASADPWPT